jgi:hypothetical protein
MKVTAPEEVTIVAVAMRCSARVSAEALRLHSFLTGRKLAGGQNLYQAWIASIRISDWTKRISVHGSSTIATVRPKPSAEFRLAGYFSLTLLRRVVRRIPGTFFPDFFMRSSTSARLSGLT